jgi:hypothetical protein
MNEPLFLYCPYCYKDFIVAWPNLATSKSRRVWLKGARMSILFIRTLSLSFSLVLGLRIVQNLIAKESCEIIGTFFCLFVMLFWLLGQDKY